MQYKKPNPTPNITQEDKHQAKIDSEILARSWAIQYREMNSEQKLIARKLISDILFHGCLENLNMSHTLEFQEILLRNSHNSHGNLRSHSPVNWDNSYPLIEQEFIDINDSRKKPPPVNENSSSSCDSPNEFSTMEINDFKFENTK